MKFREAKFQLQYQLNRPPNCSCSPGLMATIPDFNDQRCARTERLDKVCPTTSSSLPTTVTKSSPRVVQETSSPPPIQPSPTTTGYSTGVGGIVTLSTSTPDRVKPTESGGNKITITTPKDTKSPTGLPDPTQSAVTTRDQGFTIVVIAIGAGVLLLIFLIGCLLLCRYVVYFNSYSDYCFFFMEKMVQHLRY